MANEPQKKSAFREWYEQDSVKIVVNATYCLGASVVLIGALFKLMHWPGAGIMLTAGMCTEAFLFAIGVFDKPHIDYHWENMFPVLLEDEAKPVDLNEVKGGKGNGISGIQPITVPSVTTNAGGGVLSSLADADVQTFREGLKKLTDTAGKLADLGKVTAAAEQLTQNMVAAGASAAQFAQGQQQLNQISANLGTQLQGLNEQYATVIASVKQVSDDTKQSNAGVRKVNDQLNALNAAYELQLQSLNAQSAAFNQIAKNSQSLGQAADDVLKSYQSVANAQKALATQVEQLNKVYGSMLNAVA